MRRLVGLLVLFACAAPMTAREAHAQVIDTRSPLLGGVVARDGYTLSAENWYLIGQTWQAPSVSAGQTLQLDDFTFWLYGRDVELPAATFTARVQAWDGTAPTGPLLYESAAQTGPAASPGTVPFLFAPTGGLLVTPGALYVAYLYAGPPTPQDPTQPAFLTTSTGVAASGNGFRYLEGGQYLVSAGYGVESTGAPGMPETPFLAHFTTSGTSTVPEPGTVALLGTGLAVLGLTARRRVRA